MPAGSSTIYINCDLGEVANDAQLMPYINWANVACTGHAGSIESMTEAILFAKQHSICIGAHPSFEDRDNFGRVHQEVELNVLFESLHKQVHLLLHLLNAAQLPLNHIKPHGALYHAMMRDVQYAEILVELCLSVHPTPILVVQAGYEGADVYDIAQHYGIRVAREVFADRRYVGHQLVRREEGEPMLTSVRAIVEQYRQFCRLDEADTVCFHSDYSLSRQALPLL